VQESCNLPTLAEVFEHLLDTYRDPKTGKKLSMQDIAMRVPGVSVDTLYQIKQGRNTNPTKRVIVALSNVFNVPPLTFMPELWGKTFNIPPDMPGFAPFPRLEHFQHESSGSADQC
jgi:transcriptional regulator with XRE-family HTH domain